MVRAGGCSRSPAPAGCLPHSRLRSRGRYPHRPPVPPQRHDFPRIARMGRSAAGACGGEGTGRGCAPAATGASAPPAPTDKPHRASPRTYTPGPAPHHPPPVGGVRIART
ncbi:hypothetical protein DMA10_34770 [Streptomyces sp. WAC 01420]|nr:hypothetical protein DMA10_34770 [Streptomyces sp. WAC 01420]